MSQNKYSLSLLDGNVEVGVCNLFSQKRRAEKEALVEVENIQVLEAIAKGKKNETTN